MTALAAPRANLWSRVRRLFATDEARTVPAAAPPARPRAPAAAPPPRAAPTAFSPDDHARIEALLTQRPAGEKVVSGRINLLNIDEIRLRLGTKWPRYEEQVHHLAVETLKRRLSDKDFFTRSGDGTYMVLFHNASEAEAKLKCALLGQEISRKFFGEMEAGTDCVLQVETVVTTVDGRVVRQGVRLADAVAEAMTSAARSADGEGHRQTESPTPEEMRHLLAVAEQRFEEIEGGRKGESEISLVRDHMRELIRQLKNIEGVLASPDREWVAMASADCPEAGARFMWHGEAVNPMDVVREFIARADRTLERAGKPVVWVYEDEEAQDTACDVHTTYLPLWSVARKSVGLYLCRSHVTSGDRTMAAGSPVDAEAELNLAAIIDRITLRRAKAALQGIADRGLSCLLVVPVHFSTLNRPGAAESYLPVCHGIPQELRRMIVWEIRKAPVDGWSTQVQRVIAGLQPLGRAVFVLCELKSFTSPLLHRLFGRLAGEHVQGIGIDIASCDGSEDDLAADLERFAAAAAKHGLSPYAHGVHSLSVSTAAICAGFEHISGKVVAEPLEAPDGLHDKPLATLYARAADLGPGSDDPAPVVASGHPGPTR